MKKQYPIISDIPFFFLVIGLIIFSLVTLYSATYKMINMGVVADYWVKQLVWISIGFLFMLIISNMDYKNFGHVSWICYVINIFLLILVLVIGRKISGSQRWIRFGGFALQPAEFMKITFIVSFSWYLYLVKNERWGLKKFFISCIIVGIPMFLILKEPDLGTTLVFVPIFISMLFVAGLPLKYLFFVIGTGIISSPLAWMFLKEYQKKRIFVFLNPYSDQFGSGWTIIQSKIAVGSGRFFGKGFLQGTQTQLNFLPEHHTDFIFSVLAEEWGFLGALSLILLLFFLIVRAIYIAKESCDEFGCFMITGIVTMIGFQTLVNIGMTIGLMPATGLPLPLMSYGGSSALTILIAFGIILSVKKV